MMRTFYWKPRQKWSLGGETMEYLLKPLRLGDQPAPTIVLHKDSRRQLIPQEKFELYVKTIKHYFLRIGLIFFLPLIPLGTTDAF